MNGSLKRNIFFQEFNFIPYSSQCIENQGIFAYLILVYRKLSEKICILKVEKTVCLT